MKLEGRVALVTGASQGIGHACALALAREGASIAVAARNQQKLDELVAQIAAAGGKASAFVIDVADEEQVKSGIKSALAQFGKIDILVNNAGCNVRKPALDVTWEDWNLVLDTNLRGTFFVAQAVARHMIPRAYGRIINIGSVTSVAGYAGLGPYGASRGGVKQLTMSLADDWGSHGITVNCLAPGWFKTAQNAVMYENKEWVAYLKDRIPLKRPGQPNDLDGAIVFLASDASEYVTGQTLLVDGGISIGAVKALASQRKS